MSIASDIRSYADTAVAEGKKVLDQAQSQLGEVGGSVQASANDYFGRYAATARENVSDIADKAGEAVNELRASAEKAINLDAIKSAVEPYLAQVKDYQATVTDRAEDLLSTVTSDKRVAKIVDTASSVSGTVVEQVQLRVVQPVQARLGSKPVATVTKPASKPSPAGKPSPAKSTTSTRSTKPAATKPAAPIARPSARTAAPKRSTKA